MRVICVGSTGAVNMYISRIFVDMCYVWYDGPSDTSTFINDLKGSLSTTLDAFPPLAGRMANKGEYIDCNNAGVLFDVQHKPGGARDVAAVPAYGVYCHIPDQRRVVKGEDPVLTVLVTVFEDGGVAVGVAFSHAVMDGGSFLM